MSDSPSIALAFAAGLVSFVSPCCLPLVPGYLATVSGIGVQDVGRRFDVRVLGRSLVFVGTFSAVFVALGLVATTLGAFLFDSQPMLNTVAGAAIVVMGALFLASAFVTRLNREWRPPGRRPAVGHDRGRQGAGPGQPGSGDHHHREPDRQGARVPRQRAAARLRGQHRGALRGPVPRVSRGGPPRPLAGAVRGPLSPAGRSGGRGSR